jgi:D-alanine-D-alanine ligase
MVKKVMEMAGGKRLDVFQPILPKNELKMNQPLRITVLAGGPSRERPVSLVSGKYVAEALKAAGFTVTLADITPDDLSALDLPADVIFPVLHGRFGEDGELQEILEKRGLTYCGSGAAACRITMDKNKSKRRMVELEIPTPAYDVAETVADIPRVTACWPIPVVVKPIEEGSSFGVTIVKRAEGFQQVVRETLDKYGPTMVEEFIDGRELTVGILADKALPIIEIRASRGFYDYEAKYTDSGTEYTFIEDLPKVLYDQIQDMSVRSAAGLGLRDFCRIDWRLDGENRPFFLEANAIPGFTDHSLLPKAAKQAGLDMVKLCKTLVEMALRRRQAVR